MPLAASALHQLDRRSAIVDVASDNGGAVRGKMAGEFLAEAARRTGDRDGLAGDAHEKPAERLR